MQRTRSLTELSDEREDEKVQRPTMKTLLDGEATLARDGESNKMRL